MTAPAILYIVCVDDDNQLFVEDESGEHSARFDLDHASPDDVRRHIAAAFADLYAKEDGAG